MNLEDMLLTDLEYDELINANPDYSDDSLLQWQNAKTAWTIVDFCAAEGMLGAASFIEEHLMEAGIERPSRSLQSHHLS